MAVAKTSPVVSAAAGEKYFEKDDYYTRNMENRDCWAGKLAKEFGLEGNVKKGEFNKILETVENRKTGRKNTPALDVTINAQKSISLAMCLDKEHNAELQDIWMETMKETVAEIESEIIKTRRGKGGKDVHKTGNLCAAILNHELNRANEPHKHCHIIIMNMTKDTDGKLTAIYNLDLMKSQKEISQITNRILAKKLQEHGYEIEITNETTNDFELKGISKEAMRKFSSRSRAAKKYMAKHDLHGQKGMQEAVLATRQKKDIHADLSAIKSEVSTYLREHGEKVIKHQEPIQIDEEKERKKIFKAVLADMEMESFSFTKKQFTDRLCKAGILVNMTKEQAENLLKNTTKLTEITNQKTGKRELAFKSNIVLEREMISRYEHSRGKCRTTINSRTAERLLAEVIANRQHAAEARGKTFHLKPEQSRMVLDLLTAGGKQGGTVVLVNGQAGTGKTFTMGVWRECIDLYAKQTGRDFTIQGACFTGKASAELQDDAGIESTTADSFIFRKENKSLQNLPALTSGSRQVRANNRQNAAARAELKKKDFDHKKDVHTAGLTKGKAGFIVVDEAGMMSDHKMAMLMKVAEAEGKTLILTGDVDQIPPIGSGQPMRLLRDHGAQCTYLTDIQRQKDKDFLEAVKEIAGGSVDLGFEILDRKNYDNCLAQYHEARETGTAAIIKADTPKIAEKLTAQIRQERKEAGEITDCREFETRDNGRQEFGVGDRIQLNSKSIKIGIKRGEVATIAAMDEYGKITAHIDSGKEVTFYADKYTNFAHAYAITNPAYVPAATKILESTQGIREITNQREREATACKLYLEIGDRKQVAIIANTNATRIRMNEQVHKARVEAGEIQRGQVFEIEHKSGKEIIQEQREFSAGERIIFTRNDKQMGVMNGTLANIESIDEYGKVTAITDNNTKIEWYADKYKYFDQAYALTVPKEQGASVGRRVIYLNTADEINSRNQLNVGASRNKEDFIMLTDNAEKLRDNCAEWVHKTSIADIAPHSENSEYKNKIERAAETREQEPNPMSMNNGRDLEQMQTLEQAMEQTPARQAEAAEKAATQEAARNAEQARQRETLAAEKKAAQIETQRAAEQAQAKEKETAATVRTWEQIPEPEQKQIDEAIRAQGVASPGDRQDYCEGKNWYKDLDTGHYAPVDRQIQPCDIDRKTKREIDSQPGIRPTPVQKMNKQELHAEVRTIALAAPEHGHHRR